jgi:hypothetical protein
MMHFDFEQKNVKFGPSVKEQSADGEQSLILVVTQTEGHSSS